MYPCLKLTRLLPVFLIDTYSTMLCDQLFCIQQKISTTLQFTHCINSLNSGFQVKHYKNNPCLQLTRLLPVLLLDTYSRMLCDQLFWLQQKISTTLKFTYCCNSLNSGFQVTNCCIQTSEGNFHDRNEIQMLHRFQAQYLFTNLKDIHRVKFIDNC